LIVLSVVLFRGASALSAATPPASGGAFAQANAAEAAAFHTQTHWQVRTSVVYEAFGLLNALSGDALAAAQYPAETAQFAAGLDGETRAALQRLAAYQQRSGVLLSAVLARNFSAVNPATLDEAIGLAREPERLRQALRAEAGCRNCPAGGASSARAWADFSAILPDVAAALEYLRAAGFEIYWQNQILPGLAAGAAEVERFASGYNIVPVVERSVGRALPGDTVTVYLAYFQRPYGHRLAGMQLVSTPGLSPARQVQTAIHELLHPAYDPADADVQRGLRRLAENGFIRQAFDGRDPRYPYNTWSSYLDENAVRALEQTISADLGLPQPWDWVTADGGMHVLAPVLVDLMATQGFPASGENFQAFLLRNINDGTLLSVEQATAMYAEVVQR